MEDFRGLNTPQMSITFHDYFEDTSDGPEYRMLQTDEPLITSRTFHCLDHRNQSASSMSTAINFASNLNDSYQPNFSEMPPQVADFFADQENAG